MQCLFLTSVPDAYKSFRIPFQYEGDQQHLDSAVEVEGEMIRWVARRGMRMYKATLVCQKLPSTQHIIVYLR